MTNNDDLRILIVAEHASIKFGGEAALPVHYFRVLRKRGMDVWMVVRERSRQELVASFPRDLGRIHFIPDEAVHRLLHRLSIGMPSRLAYFTVKWAMRTLTGLAARRLVRQLVRKHRIDVVHQPIPVSPKEPSLMHGLGAPLVIGPMNGGMNYPPAFRHHQSRLVTWTLAGGRHVAGLMNRLIPGKRHAALLLTANRRTTDALPPGITTPVVEVVENGVDLAMWDEVNATEVSRIDVQSVDTAVQGGGVTRYIFLGRLVGWKAVDLLLHAVQQACRQQHVELDIVGDGPMRTSLEQLAARLGIGERVCFHGWKSQVEAGALVRASAGLVLPSLLECGGAVVLEAMACARPVIATDWGGPTDYLDASCGILVPPTDRETFITSLADAMVRLAQEPELRRRMGQAGRAKVERNYDWDAKVNRIIELYALAIGRNGRKQVSASLPSSTEPVLQTDAP